MTVTAYVWNGDTGNGIPYASVQVVDGNNIPTGEGVSADENGKFSISSSALDKANYKLAFSSQGFLPAVADAATVNAAHGIGLDIETLAPVVVTPGKKIPAAWIVAGVAAIGLLIFLASKKQGKKRGQTAIGAMSSDQWVNIAIVAGVGVGVLFLVVKPILQKLGLWSSDSETATANAAAVDKSLQQVQGQGGAQSVKNFTDTQYKGWANAYLTEWRDGDADPNVLAGIILNVKSLTDLLLLIKAFDTQKVSTSWLSSCALLSINCPEFDLPAAVREALSIDQLSSLNSQLSAKGINYAF